MSKHPDNAIIKLLVSENPKRKGSEAAKRFRKYKDGMTVEQALKAGDAQKKFIKISGGKA